MTRRTFPDAKILLVDDDAENISLVRELLEMFGYENVVGISDCREAAEAFRALQPDLVLLDFHMQPLSGLDVLRQLSPLVGRQGLVPIVMLTGEESREARESALSSGAIDFLVKPFAPSELALRIGNLLRMRYLHLELSAKNETLERKVRERTRDLEDAYVDLVDRLARAAEYRDDETGLHTQRVGALSEMIALELGIPPSDAYLIGRAALLHDLGKIGVPDSILLKPTQLSVRELAEMQMHVDIGASILSNSRSCILKLAEVIALNHHERWNGSGYLGLSGEEIPLPGRIVAVADVFDALVSVRPYKPAWPIEDALEEMRRGRGTQFDPRILDAFFEVVERGLPSLYDEMLSYCYVASARSVA